MRGRERRVSERGGGWDSSGGECRGEKQIWRLGWWECTASHRYDVPLRNSRCEQIRLNARVSRKEPPSQKSTEGGGGKRAGGVGGLGGWRYYCVKTSDPRHLHLCISCIKLWDWKMRDMDGRGRKTVEESEDVERGLNPYSEAARRREFEKGMTVRKRKIFGGKGVFSNLSSSRTHGVLRSHRPGWIIQFLAGGSPLGLAWALL